MCEYVTGNKKTMKREANKRKELKNKESKNCRLDVKRRK
jgi:hypothetical protein